MVILSVRAPVESRTKAQLLSDTQGEVSVAFHMDLTRSKMVSHAREELALCPVEQGVENNCLADVVALQKKSTGQFVFQYFMASRAAFKEASEKFSARYNSLILKFLGGGAVDRFHLLSSRELAAHFEVVCKRHHLPDCTQGLICWKAQKTKPGKSRAGGRVFIH